MTKKKEPDRGRPKVSPDKKFTRRHVLNISPEVEKAAGRFCEAVGISRMTDGLRALVTKALKDQGLL